MTEPEDNVVRLDVGGHHGRLTTREGEHLPVRVYNRASDVLMLVLMVNPESELVAEPADFESAAVVEYESAHGLVRVRGQASLEERDLMRFDVLDPPEVLQRREFVRVDTVQRVVLAPEQEGEGEEEAVQISTHALDISGGGMLLGGLPDLDPGTRLRFRLELGEHREPIEGHARVVRTGDEGRRGLAFEEISSADRQRLIHFVFDTQRSALARTRGADAARQRRHR